MNMLMLARFIVFDEPNDKPVIMSLDIAYKEYKAWALSQNREPNDDEMRCSFKGYLMANSISNETKAWAFL